MNGLVDLLLSLLLAGASMFGLGPGHPGTASLVTSAAQAVPGDERDEPAQGDAKGPWTVVWSPGHISTPPNGDTKCIPDPETEECPGFSDLDDK